MNAIVNRVEVIDYTQDITKGEKVRAFSKRFENMEIEVVLQDNGKTMKIFIQPKEVLDKLTEV